MNLPFTVYDFFGYLATGFLVCIGVDFALGQHWLMRENFPPAVAIFWIATAYVIGQILATPASFILEKGFVGRCLGRPDQILFKDKQPRWRWLFCGYFCALDKGVRQRVLNTAAKFGVTEAGPALFHHARTYAKAEPKTWEKLETFLNQYGFARNMAFAFFVTAVILAGRLYWTTERYKLLYAALGAFLLGVGMFYRFLKFYRQYAFELFTSYPDLPEIRAPRT